MVICVEACSAKSGACAWMSPRQPQILHDKRVRACFVQEFCVLKGVLKLAVARKNVERNIGFYVACAAVGDGVRHLVMRKALCVAACVEHAEAI